ncbi:MAG: PEP-CTERM sorting domain-containing protein [Phycisphaera sp.]|nr:MAG: PEP-CTERM sorting domain-containing protein [Phycisphaera sp.]
MGRTMLIAAAGIAATAAVANAQAILTFGFTEVDGSFTASDGSFLGSSNASTSGDVTRLSAPGGTAVFEPGFAGVGASDFSFDIDVMITGAGTADGSGTFTITDVQGETLSGDLDGDFIELAPGVIAFNGLLSGVQFNDLSGDGTFDGPTAGSFSTDLPGTAPYDGALVQLFLDGSGGFFDADFTGISTQVSGVVIPAPASLALLGLGGLAAARRRR